MLSYKEHLDMIKENDHEDVFFDQGSITDVCHKSSQVMHSDVIQAKSQIVDWKIYHDKCGKTWKVLNSDEEVAVYKDIQQLVKACTRDDLNMMWNLVQMKFQTSTFTEVKEHELCVELKRLYEPDPTDGYWMFPYQASNISWRYYASYDVHHLSTN